MKRQGIALAAFVALVGCSEYNREAIEDNNAGMQAFRARRFSDARDRFQRAADEDPRFDQPLYNLAMVHKQQEAWAEVVSALTRAIARSPRNADYQFELGYANFRLERWDAAKQAFNQAIQISPSMYRAHYFLGKTHERLDEPQEALRSYSSTISRAPRAYAAYVSLGSLYYRVNQLDHAITVLREGLRIAPEGVTERGEMRNTLGNVLLRQGHREQAVDEFVAASREDPRLAVALFNAGFTCAEMPERRQQAILYLQRFVETRGGGERTPREYLDMAQNKLAELQTAGAH